METKELLIKAFKNKVEDCRDRQSLFRNDIYIHDNLKRLLVQKAAEKEGGDKWWANNYFKQNFHFFQNKFEEICIFEIDFFKESDHDNPEAHCFIFFDELLEELAVEEFLELKEFWLTKRKELSLQTVKRWAEKSDLPF